VPFAVVIHPDCFAVLNHEERSQNSPGATSIRALNRASTLIAGSTSILSMTIVLDERVRVHLRSLRGT